VMLRERDAFGAAAQAADGRRTDARRPDRDLRKPPRDSENR